MAAAQTWPRQFVARRAFFNFLGVRFRIYVGGHLAFFVKQKAFRLKEDITIFSDETQTQPMLQIRARNIIDFAAIYDVIDPHTGQAVGAIQRKGIRSMLRDEWHVLDPSGGILAQIQEESLGLALLRRVLFSLIPQTFLVSSGSVTLGHMKQRFNPFIHVYDVDLQATENHELNPRLGIAAAVLLLAIERRQK